MPLLYPFSVKIHTKKRSTNFVRTPFQCLYMKVNCSLILFSNDSPTWPLSTGLCDESRNLLFYLYTLQSKTLTITNDVDVSITKYFLERRWQINVINKGWFFSRWKKICVILFPYICPKPSTLTQKCVNFVNFWKEKSHRSRDEIFLFIRSRIYSLPSVSLAESDSALAESWDFLSEPKRAARAWNTAAMICHAFTFLSFFAMI